LRVRGGPVAAFSRVGASTCKKIDLLRRSSGREEAEPLLLVDGVAREDGLQVAERNPLG
jgi:hypothetical protein